MAERMLAELLLRRKELQQKVDVLAPINKDGLFVTKSTRRAVHEGIDDIISSVPKISMAQVTSAYDWHAKQLRLCDAAIQRANWETSVDIPDNVMSDFVDPYVKSEESK